MAYISKITPLGSSESYDLKAAMLTHTPNNTTTFLRGDNTWSNTLTGNLLLSKDANTAWANAPALQLTGANSKIASIKLTNSGTNLDIGWDWTAREGAGLGLRSTSATDKPGGFYLFARNATENHELIGTVGGDLTWSGLLKITNNSNTTTIGSQNANFCHIYNSANIPFIFNNSVLTTGGNLGDSTYPFDNLTLGRSNGAGIYYKGTKNTYRMIRFIDNTSDIYGNGISIGGGGQTIIGGGESADTAAAQAGTAGAEIMQVCNDGDVQIISNLQDGWNNRKVSTFNTTGNLTLPAKLVCANVGNTTGGSYTESGLEIREYNYGLDQSDTWGNAPRMTFHWGNRVQAQIGLASNGWLYTTSGYGGNLTTNPHRFVIEQGGTWNISVSGNAATATLPLGFSSQSTNATWGNTTGTTVTAWNDPSGGSIDFRQNNPSSGKLSIKVDGRFYGNEGTYPAMLMNYNNGYWGLGSDPDGGYSGWVRAPASGILTSAKNASSVGSGVGAIGAIEWRFAHVYADTLHGNAETATTGKYLWTGSANPVYGTSRLEYFNSTGTAGTPQANATSYPTSDWYHFIRMNHGNSQGYYVEIASCFHDNNMYWRRTVAGTAYPWCHVWLQGNSVTGAVWNDYAEYRETTPDSTTPGYVVFENGDDTLSLTTERLQHFAGITSDTWGFAQGETEKAKTPIAVSGRVLAYTYRDRNEYKPGDCVCAAPGGTIDIMTREEIREWPDRIVGTVSCVPEYDEWGGGELADRPSVKVNGRIWIKVR